MSQVRMTSRPPQRHVHRNVEAIKTPTSTRVRSKPSGSTPVRPLRILVSSHSHPRLSKGGSEISAYALYQALQNRPNTTSWFFGCTNGKTEKRTGSSFSQPFGDSEFIYDPSAPFDHFKFANPDPEFPRALDKLITDLQPDVVHAHHYLIFGVEAFRRIKEISPRTKIIVTLHEYIAICHNHGQMVKDKTYRLCQKETLIDCHACFPNISMQDFFLRKKYVQHFFGYVDHFIAPSQFLSDRYIAWGVPASKITVLENVMPWQQDLPQQPTIAPPFKNRADNRRLRVGFFGQMSALKGIRILVEAAKHLHNRAVHDIFFDVFGDYSNQPLPFQEEVEQALEDARKYANCSYHGPYENEDVHKLMQSVDAVLIPSIWWENSPVVIQEAFLNRRPVICSDIGGMAEKVRPGIDGWHFRARDANSLATLLEDLLANPGMFEKVRKTLTVPATPQQRMLEHVRLYESLCAEAEG